MWHDLRVDGDDAVDERGRGGRAAAADGPLIAGAVVGRGGGSGAVCGAAGGLAGWKALGSNTCSSASVMLCWYHAGGGLLVERCLQWPQCVRRMTAVGLGMLAEGST